VLRLAAGVPMKHAVRARLSVFFAIAVLSFYDQACAQTVPERGPDSALTVHVQDASGGPLPIEALVRLTSSSGSGSQVTATRRAGDADFTHLSPGAYTIQVTAVGYQSAREDVTISKGDTTEAFISLTAAGPSTSPKPYPGVPLLVGKARKELDAAIKSLEANQIAEASAHAANALKYAPAHPDVQYIAGLCASLQKDFAGAQKHYESAVGIYPNHISAQLGLGTLLLQQNEAAAAVPHLEKVLSLDPNNWRAHWLVAEAYLSAEHDAAKGKLHALRAIELGGEKAVDAQITLARAEIIAGERDAARNRLQKFLHDYPHYPDVPRARALLRELEEAPAPPPGR
jgi:Flp pilus assembly protein TadD